MSYVRANNALIAPSPDHVNNADLSVKPKRRPVCRRGAGICRHGAPLMRLCRHAGTSWCRRVPVVPAQKAATSKLGPLKTVTD